MKFRVYCEGRGITLEQAAAGLEVNVERARFWWKHLVVPRKVEVERIFAWSDWQVRPEDWYDLPETAAPAPEAAQAAAT